MASPPSRLNSFGVVHANHHAGVHYARPISTRFEPVLDLRGFDH